jgi:hypothetical protein
MDEVRKPTNSDDCSPRPHLLFALLLLLLSLLYHLILVHMSQIVPLLKSPVRDRKHKAHNTHIYHFAYCFV